MLLRKATPKRFVYQLSAHVKFSILLLFILSGSTAFSQMAATFSKTPNTKCNGSGCNYTGPSILINELMISPTSNDGSISGNGGVSTGRGEWIELYNPNLCEPVDISCYYLGNNTSEGNGGYVIPAGTIVPPAGFAMIRGVNVAAVPSNLLVQNGGNVVELIVPGNISDMGVCAGGSRVWFPNAGGWFAFYDNNGVPQDAVSWVNSNTATSGAPCVATRTGCSGVVSLPSYNNIPANRKALISTLDASSHMGRSLRRMPDGGAWSGNGTPTYAICNSTCATPSASSCAGTAQIAVTGGTAPYTYVWNDSQAQLTQSATGLCAGTYTVIVTDATSQQAQFNVTIDDFVPTVNLDLTDQVCIDVPAFTLTGITPVAAAGQTGVLTGTGLTGTTFNPQTAGPGQHTITYNFTDENGCNNSATDNITVNPLPVVSIAGLNPSYCTSTTPVPLTLTPAGGTLTGPGATNNTFVPATAGLGTHTLTYSYTDPNGCSSSTTATVEVFGIPAPTITVPEFLCDYAPAIPLVGTPAGGVFMVNTTQTSTFDPVAVGAGTHNITYVYTDANNCQASASETIDVLPRPVLGTNLAAHYCFGTQAVTITPTPAGGTLSGTLLTGNTINLVGVVPGNYSITYEYTDANGCENTLTSPFLLTTPVKPDFMYTTDCFQKAAFVNLTATTPPGNQFAWVVGPNQSNQTNPNMAFAIPGDYAAVLTVTDTYGCSYDTIKPVTIPVGLSMNDFVVPNVITPNGDGINDFLLMPELLSECITYKILILNRWGNLVYEMNSTQNAFAGKDKGGNELMGGVYFYLVESEDFDCNDPQYKGFCSGIITVVR